MTTHFGCILLGAPGSGKGTQAKVLSDDLRIPHVSTGDILRSEVQSESQLGIRVKEIMSSGQLVSDALICEIVAKRFYKPDLLKGYILDGFPRTVAQADALETILIERGLPQPKVILLNVGNSILIERLTGRLTCSQCGRAFHKTLNPPKAVGKCDACDGELVQRKDDSLKTVKKRLEVYEDETKPLIDFYSQKGHLSSLSGDQEMFKITTGIRKVLGA